MSKLDKGSSLLLTKAASCDYTYMRNEQVLTCGLCHSFQICQFAGFKQTLFQLLWSPANPGPLNVNQTLLHHARLFWSRYFIFRLQLTVEQFFRLSQLLLSCLFILRLKKLNFIPTGSSGQGEASCLLYFHFHWCSSRLPVRSGSSPPSVVFLLWSHLDAPSAEN